MAEQPDCPESRFEAFYTSHFSRVHGYTRRRIEAGLVDDVVSEVFLVAWRRRDEIPLDFELPWLLSVAQNVIRNMTRSSLRRLRVVDQLQQILLSRGQLVVAPEGDARLGDALADLSLADREILLLIAWDGLTPAEAASVMGIRPQRFSVRLHRARRRLEQALARREMDSCKPAGPVREPHQIYPDRRA
jgi:RNA polymerase sigma-70 factor (ECF subfamily)